MIYEKEKGIAKSILRFAPLYAHLPDGEKRKIEKRIASMNLTILGFILEELNKDLGNMEFFYLVEDTFISLLATNDYQKEFLKDSLEYHIDNERRVARQEQITLDTYNSGKHCDKFGRGKSTKKAKGKAYSKVRVKEIRF